MVNIFIHFVHCCWKPKNLLSGTSISGIYFIGIGGGVPQTLHEVDVPILKNDECQDMFHKSGHLKAIRDSFICAGYAEGFKDSCEGNNDG
jgi:hypothetical protein